MKSKLLSLVLCLLSFASFSQTNGWYQYHKATHISGIDADASGNLHLATNSGYMMYNTTTNMVEDYANLTSQNPPIGSCSSVKVNPTNNNIALGLLSGQGIVIYDGTNYTIYNSGNSDYGNFSAPQLHYTDSGLLYIYDTTDTKYQTFENGVFSVIKNLTFRPHALIENAAGTVTYFAARTSGGLVDGFYELDKATDTYTHYTTSNSGITHNGVNCFYRDANDLLYIGGHRGVNTLDTMGNWTTYQEPLPMNPSIFYSVYSMHKFSDGTFLVNNSDPNSSSQNGFSTVDFTTNTWTHFDSSVYCNASDQVQNMVLANDMVYTHFRKFTNPLESSKLWSFDTSNNTCEEQDVNHLNVVNLGLYGTTGLAIRQSPTEARQSQNNISILELLWTNNGGRDLNSLGLPVNSNFSDGFPDSNIELVATNSLNIIQPIEIVEEPILIVGEDNGLFFIDDSISPTFVPHALGNFRAVFLDLAFSLNNGETSFGLIGGWNNDTFEYELRIIEVFGTVEVGTGNISNASLRFSEPFGFGVGFSGVVDTATCKDENNSLNFTVSGQTSTGEKHIVNLDYTPETNTNSILASPSIAYSVNIDEFVDFQPSISYRDINNDDGKSPCFQGTDNIIYCTNFIGESVVFDSSTIDINGDGSSDAVLVDPHLTRGTGALTPQQARRLFYGTSQESDNTKSVSIINVNGVSSGSNRNTSEELNFEIIPSTTIENLPNDFYILNTYIYIYSDTHFAAAMSTTHGLLINTAIDYSSLPLSNDEVVANDNDLIMYPNPATDIVSFSDKTINSIVVYDINGRQVLNAKSNRVSVKNLAKGIYILKAKNANGITASKKLIKE